MIVILSDGDANITTGLTPATDPCQQGIAAAETAESSPQKDWVFAIAYGAIYAKNGGCQYDTSEFNNGTITVNYDDNDGLTPQCALELMVDNAVTNPAFAGMTDLQVAQQICKNSLVTTIPGSNRYYGQTLPILHLEKVFQQVGEALTSPRLIPDGAT